MSYKGVVRYDRFLTDIAVAYPTGNLIGKTVCPIKTVSNYSDYIYVDGDDAITLHNDGAEGTSSNGVDFSTGTPYSYRATRKALHSILTQKEIQNAEKPVNLEQRETMKLTNRLLLAHEKRVADNLTSTSVVTNYEDVDATANARWDESSPDLEASIITGVKSIYTNTGMNANTIAIPFQAALYAANMDFIKNTLQYQYGMQVVSASFQNQVRRLVGLPPYIKGLKVVISDGRMDDSRKGQDANVVSPWSNNCLIGYVPENTLMDNVFGCLTAEYESLKVSKEKLNDPKGVKILTEWDYDIVDGDYDAWYLLQNVIAL